MKLLLKYPHRLISFTKSTYINRTFVLFVYSIDYSTETKLFILNIKQLEVGRNIYR